MIYDIDRIPKSITLLRLNQANGRFVAPSSLSDVVPLLEAGVGEAGKWRPDLTTSQEWAFSRSISQSPLANGTMAANHSRRLPVQLTFEAVITDTPMLPFGGLGGLPGVRRADALWASLQALYESGAFVAVISPVAVLANALIESLALNRSAEDGSAYYVSITITEQQTYELKLLPNIDDQAAQNGAAITTSGGIVFGGV